MFVAALALQIAALSQPVLADADAIADAGAGAGAPAFASAPASASANAFAPADASAGADAGASASASAGAPVGAGERRGLVSVSGDRARAGLGVEASALWPVFPGSLFQARAAIPVAFGGRGQLLIGAQGHIPHDRDDEGRFSSIAGHLGVRGYLWKGLHVDAATNVGWGRLRASTVDGRSYDSLDVELMALAGWRVEVGPVYALVQPLGIASVVYRSNPWPIAGEGKRTTEPPIYVGNVALGVQF